MFHPRGRIFFNPDDSDMSSSIEDDLFEDMLPASRNSSLYPSTDKRTTATQAPPLELEINLDIVKIVST